MFVIDGVKVGSILNDPEEEEAEATPAKPEPAKATAPKPETGKGGA